MSPYPVAWIVRYGDGLAALFLDKARAEHAAVVLHGVISPLYEL
ncbi:MAG: hypothetical protein V4696_05105 [Pseudomonadota bacterium]